MPAPRTVQRETIVMYTAYSVDGPSAAGGVKTISDQNFFMLGRADGWAIARDTTVLW